jgi:hypothetical protein
MKSMRDVKDAVDAGKRVCWKQSNYVVEKDAGGYIVRCTNNDHCVGLYWLDGVTTDYKPADFYIE